MKKTKTPRIRGTYYLSLVGAKCDEARALILRRRLQVLVHSCIYYRFGESLITDEQWTTWAKELYHLQKQYPYISSRVDYHEYFRDFDYSTGFNLPYNLPEIVNKAEYLISTQPRKEHHAKKKESPPPGGKSNRSGGNKRAPGNKRRLGKKRRGI